MIIDNYPLKRVEVKVYVSIHSLSYEKHSSTSWSPFKPLLCSLHHMSLRCGCVVRVCVCVYDVGPELCFTTQGYYLPGKRREISTNWSKMTDLFHSRKVRVLIKSAECVEVNMEHGSKNPLESSRAVNIINQTTLIKRETWRTWRRSWWWEDKANQIKSTN